MDVVLVGGGNGVRPRRDGGGDDDVGVSTGQLGGVGFVGRLEEDGFDVRGISVDLIAASSLEFVASLLLRSSAANP